MRHHDVARGFHCGSGSGCAVGIQGLRCHLGIGVVRCAVAIRGVAAVAVATASTAASPLTLVAALRRPLGARCSVVTDGQASACQDPGGAVAQVCVDVRRAWCLWHAAIGPRAIAVAATTPTPAPATLAFAFAVGRCGIGRNGVAEVAHHPGIRLGRRDITLGALAARAPTGIVAFTALAALTALPTVAALGTWRACRCFALQRRVQRVLDRALRSAFGTARIAAAA